MTLPRLRTSFGACAFACAATVLLVATASAQRQPRIPIGIDAAFMRTTALGGAGFGYQVTVSTALPISLLGARYTAGAQFWQSRPQIAGNTIGKPKRELTAVGAHVTAAWNVANRVFPYVRLPVQGIYCEVLEDPFTPGGVDRRIEVPLENEVGETTSIAFGIAGGTSVRLARSFGLFVGATALTNHLYQTNRTPIWSLELGVNLSAGGSRRP